MKNVSEFIRQMSELYPNKDSIIAPKRDKYVKYTFLELEQRINKLCHKLSSLDIGAGDKVLILIKPNIDFCVITFALFRLGAVAVFIDPGMPKKMLLKCIHDLKPDILLGLPIIHFLSSLFPKTFSSIRVYITNSRYDGLLRAKSLYQSLETYSCDRDIYIPYEGELAAILFTSGGTGAAKGVEYTHDIFINQTTMLQKEFNLKAQDKDIPGFPLFSFFTLSMGMTSIIPDMNFAKPAKCNPKKIVKNILDHQATFLAGSPAIWERVAKYCVENKIELPSVRFAVMFGAPVSFKIHENFQKILPHGDSATPYGATECLPVTNINGSDVLSKYKSMSQKGAGMCVGHPLKGVELKIIEITEGPINEFKSITELPDERIGEIIVSSENVTKKYYNNEKATSLAKIMQGSKVWHRMGDVGYLKSGQLWFCGRVKHSFRFENHFIFPVCYELIFDELPELEKTALVAGKMGPALFIKSKKKDVQFIQDKINLSKSDFPELTNLKEFYFRKKFPVDIRHNIKIDRTKLSNEIRGVK